MQLSEQQIAQQHHEQQSCPRPASRIAARCAPNRLEAAAQRADAAGPATAHNAIAMPLNAWGNNG